MYRDAGIGKQAPIIIAVTQKELRDQIAEENRKIGHCALGYAAAPLNAPAQRKSNYVYYIK